MTYSLKVKTFILLYFIALSYGIAQEQRKYKIRTIAFYNVENLFDTINDPNTFDDDRTPLGKDNWTSNKYYHKLNQLAHVITNIGAEVSNTSPDIIGLCEVESKLVLKDLIARPQLIDKNYGIVHFDSPDERGIDVALLYKKKTFVPTSFKSHRLLLFNADGERDYTRDQLVVGGMLDTEQFYFIINHWPSRSGGEARSKPGRMAAAKLNKRIIDSISKFDSSAKIMSMGDFNDDPTSDSFKKVLKTIGKKKKLEKGTLFNPMERLYKKGEGSLAYRDKWNLFDQYFFTDNLISTNKQTYSFWKANIFSPKYLHNSSGKYKGYPARTYAGGSYNAQGFSDHFPVFVHLIKEVPTNITQGN